MSYLDWHIGMKVVCVDDTFDDDRPLRVIAQETIPEAGEVYTIRGIGFFLPHLPNRLCVRLVEITNPNKLYRQGRYERAFGIWRFRPVKTRTTDIAIFTQLLNPSKVDA